MPRKQRARYFHQAAPDKQLIFLTPFILPRYVVVCFLALLLHAVRISLIAHLKRDALRGKTDQCQQIPLLLLILIIEYDPAFVSFQITFYVIGRSEEEKSASLQQADPSPMEANLSSTAEWSNTTTWSTTFIWCYLIPLIHVFSLISNILCIVVFCSNVFIKKPIAIYFICLLLSDSIILLVGYADITDRKSHHLSDSGLCLINKNILHTWKEHIFTLMERFCLEWILYKILWLRVSTILLAILSIQRTRTFFSLSYHESRFCAFSACVFSFTLALIITGFEWHGIHYSGVTDERISLEVLHKILDDNSSRELYSMILHRSYDQAIGSYPCLMEPFDVASAMNMTNQVMLLSRRELLVTTISVHRD